MFHHLELLKVKQIHLDYWIPTSCLNRTVAEQCALLTYPGVMAAMAGCLLLNHTR